MSNWDIVYTPLVAPWVLWLFGALIICVWLYFIIRRMPGALLRGPGLLLGLQKEVGLLHMQKEEGTRGKSRGGVQRPLLC